MRTTIEFDEDTAAAINELRSNEGLGVSEAVNELIRRGLLPREQKSTYTQKTERLGLKIDVSNVADALEVLEEPDAR